MANAIVLFGFAALVVGLVLLFRKGWRKIGAWMAVGGILTSLVGAAIGGRQLGKQEAHNGGFSTVEEYKAAKAAGFAEATAYRAALDTAKAQGKIQSQKAAEAEEQRKAVADTVCRADLQCWGGKNLTYATAPCSRMVERLAKNSHQWTDKWYEQKFDRFRWAGADKKVLTFIGDHIQYQNGFGAWINHIYQCDYDPVKKVVVDARATAGRLPAD